MTLKEVELLLERFAKLIGAVMVICGFFAGLWAVLWGPVHQLFDDVANIKGQVERLSRDVQLLQVPGRIVEYSPNSRAIGVWSKETGSGTISLTVQPTAEGSECKLIWEATQHMITSYETGSTYPVETIKPIPQNLGSMRQTVELDVRIPHTMPLGRAEYRMTTFYTGCPWQKDGRPPVVQTGPAIAVTITE